MTRRAGGWEADVSGRHQKEHLRKVTRELIPGSLEVYPLHGYGAVEIGVHRFHHPGDSDVGEAKFVQLLAVQDGRGRFRGDQLPWRVSDPRPVAGGRGMPLARFEVSRGAGAHR